MKGPIEYIKEAWVIYTKKENFIFFAKIMAVLTIISTILSTLYNYLFPFRYPEESVDYSNIPMVVVFIVLTLLSTVFYFYSQSTAYVSILNTGINEKEIFRMGFKKMWKFFLISLVVGLIIGFGAILLLIPALIFGIWYSFSLFLVMDRDLKVGQALKQSKIMVKGKFWKVLGRNCVFGLFGFAIGFVVGLVPYVGVMVISFLAPLFILPSYLLYRDLSAGLNNLGTV